MRHAMRITLFSVLFLAGGLLSAATGPAAASPAAAVPAPEAAPAPQPAAFELPAELGLSAPLISAPVSQVGPYCETCLDECVEERDYCYSQCPPGNVQCELDCAWTAEACYQWCYYNAC